MTMRRKHFFIIVIPMIIHENLLKVFVIEKIP